MIRSSATELQPVPGIMPAITVEMDRIECLTSSVLRHREGKTVGPERRQRLIDAQAAVVRNRESGLFGGLLDLAQGLDTNLALDCLMVVAYSLVRPSRAHVLQGLTGQSSVEFFLTQGLLHELLMPDDSQEARLSEALSTNSSLIRNGLVRVEGEGPTRQLRPGFALARFISGSEGSLTPPVAVRLVFEPGQPLQPIFLEPRVNRRLAELEALIGLLADGRQPMAGPAVLFVGGPGTGKSLAVHHMASRLNRPLYQIDLGRVVSKWLGDTERNLSRVFTELCGTEGCILLDEADSLLGKRIEVKESRDQHANMTVSHLLGLLERHRGPVFMTTNLRGNLDDAYTRRLGAVVEFHQPDRDLRQRIWKSALGKAAPELPDHLLDSLLPHAAHAAMSAAEIVNSAVMTAALGRKEGRLPGPEEIARAIMLEKSKGEMTFSRTDLGPLAEYWGAGEEL